MTTDDLISVNTVGGEMIVLVNGHRLRLDEQQAEELAAHVAKTPKGVKMALNIQNIAIILTDYQADQVRSEVPRVLKIIKDTK